MIVYRNLATFTLLVTLLWSVPTLAKGEWTPESRQNGIALYSRDVSNSGMDAYRASMTLPYSPGKVMTILSDPQSFRHITPDLVEVRTLGQEHRDNGSTVTWVYHRLDLSGVDDRDYVIRATTRNKTVQNGEQWTIEFRAVRDKGPRPKLNAVRVTRLKGGWFLQPMEDGIHTRLTYIRHIELGGTAPNWMIRSGVEESMFLSLQNLRKYCKRQLRP